MAAAVAIPSLTDADGHALPMHRAVLLALVIEAALVSGVIAWLTLRTPEPPPPPQPPPMRLQLVEVPPAPPKPEIIAPPEPKPEPKPKPIEKPVPQPKKPPPKPLPPVVAPVVPMTAPPDAPPAPAAMVAAEIARPMPPAPSNQHADITADFESKVRAAIQSALHYPVAAKAMGREGRVRVGFDFIDGLASNIRVVQSGDLDVFDHAAEAAVEAASYPVIPAELQHRSLHFVIWVEFLKKRN